MKEVVDRIVQYPNRYKLTDVSTGQELGTYDFTEVTGTVEQVGTEIDAELFKNFAQIDGNYPSLIAGGFNSQQLTNEDLDTLRGTNYIGRFYHGAAGNTVSNKPAGVDAFGLWVIAASRIGIYGNTVQVLYYAVGSTSSTKPTVYQRCYSANTWSAWEEIVTSDGSYPNLGAGYLAKRAFVGELNGDQWIKWATVSYPLAIRGSVLFLVNGGQDPNAEGSGILELNLVRQVENVSLVVCSGYIKSENFAYVINGTSIDLYVYCKSYRDYQIAVLDELAGVDLNTETYVTFSNVGTGSATAPANAVYAVNRNNADYDGDGNQISTTYAKQTGSYPTLGAGYLAQEFSLNNNTKTGWANVGSVPVGNNYSCIFFVNGVQHVQGKSNAEESGILEVDYASDGAVLSVLSGNLPAEKFCATVVDNTLTLYHNMTATYNTCQFIILAQKIYGGRVEDSQVFTFASPTYGQSAPANAVYAVVRNIASYAESIPAASQTVLGGVKVYKDSEGYLNIDTQ